MALFLSGACIGRFSATLALKELALLLPAIETGPDFVFVGLRLLTPLRPTISP
jgi:hypothetical protein